jgi:hypothetical protein
MLHFWRFYRFREDFAYYTLKFFHLRDYHADEKINENVRKSLYSSKILWVLSSIKKSEKNSQQLSIYEVLFCKFRFFLKEFCVSRKHEMQWCTFMFYKFDVIFAYHTFSFIFSLAWLYKSYISSHACYVIMTETKLESFEHALCVILECRHHVIWRTKVPI